MNRPVRFSLLTVAALVGSAAVAALPSSAQAAGVQISLPGLGTSSGSLTAYAWPNGEVLDALPVDAEVPMIPVNLVGLSAGVFRVGTAVGADYREGDGSINLDVLASTNFGTARMSMPTSGSTLRIPVDGTSLSFGIADLDKTAVPLRPSPTCVTVKQANHQTPMESYVQANGSIAAPVHVEEKVNMTQELGVSLSTDGGTTFKASGEVSVTHKTARGGTDTTGPRATAQLWKNQANYYRFKTRCAGRTTYRWRPTSLYNLNGDFDVVTHPVYAHCGGKPAGGSFSKTSGKSNKYSAGVGLTPVKVSATAEWGTDVTLVWEPNVNVKYCGTSVDGPENSALVEVHAA